MKINSSVIRLDSSSQSLFGCWQCKRVSLPLHMKAVWQSIWCSRTWLGACCQYQWLRSLCWASAMPPGSIWWRYMTPSHSYSPYQSTQGIVSMLMHLFLQRACWLLDINSWLGNRSFFCIVYWITKCNAMKGRNTTSSHSPLYFSHSQISSMLVYPF